jgi:uncharacterized protein YdaU (DUF1376 family)
MNRKMYQPFFWGDYLRDTGQLTLLEHGAYLRLIGEYWNTGQPIEADAERIARACGAHSDTDKAAISYVLNRYFTLEGGYWHHKRIDADLTDNKSRIEKASLAARKAAIARWEGGEEDAPRMRTASEPQCERNAIHSTPNKDIPPTPKGESVKFDAFWEAYPDIRKTDRKKCVVVWQRNKLDDVADKVMAGLEAWKASNDWTKEGGKYTKGPLPWLRGEYWLTPPAAPPKKSNDPFAPGYNPLGNVSW